MQEEMQQDLGTKGLKSLRQYYTEGGEESNKCNQCEKVCFTIARLKMHMKSHGGEKSHKCNQCDFASSYENHLISHKKTHSEVKS